jgi:preprotein translocase subunit SecA
MMDKLGLEEDQPIQHSMITKSLESAQRRVEGYNFDIRKHLVEYDDVMNKQRAYIYKLRRNVLEKESLKEDISDMLRDEIETIVDQNTDVSTNEPQVNEIVISFEALTGVRTDIKNDLKNKSAVEVKEILSTIIFRVYDDKEQRIGSELMRILEKAIYLRTIDMLWIDHLDAMNHLREGIGLRAYAQKDSLVEYKNESYQMFKSLLGAINSEVSNLIFRAEISPEQSGQTKLTKAAAKATPQETESKSRTQKAVVKKSRVGRNDPCPCGSGKKYKKCCGK